MALWPCRDALSPSSNACIHASQYEIDEAITAIIDKVLEEGPAWFWHGKEYLGAVHGSIGILTQIVLSEPARAAQIKGLLGESIAAQSPETGNWPSSAESGREHLVQFCDGASGFVVSLLATRQYYTHDNTLNILPNNDTVAVSPICGRPLVKLDVVARLTTPCLSKVSLSLPGIELRPEVGL